MKHQTILLLQDDLLLSPLYHTVHLFPPLHNEFSLILPTAFHLFPPCSGSCGLRGSGGYTATTGCTDPIELPGHYMHGNEVTKEGAVLLEGFGAKVWVVRRNSVTCRRLEFVGSDGHTRGMLVQSGQNWGPGPVSTDERIVQLTRQLNRRVPSPSPLPSLFAPP